MTTWWFDGWPDFVTQLGVAISAVGVLVSFVQSAPPRWLGPEVLKGAGQRRDEVAGLTLRRRGWMWVGDAVTAAGLLVAVIGLVIA